MPISLLNGWASQVWGVIMFVLQFPVLHETWFCVSALLLSTILGIRGIAIQMHGVENENIGLKKEGKVEWHPWQRVLVHYFQDFIYNFVGSLAGWIALYVLSYRLFKYTGPNLSTPPGFLLVQPNVHLLGWSDLGLTVIALLGITAKLPQTIEGFILSIGKAVETITGKLTRN